MIGRACRRRQSLGCGPFRRQDCGGLVPKSAASPRLGLITTAQISTSRPRLRSDNGFVGCTEAAIVGPAGAPNRVRQSACCSAPLANHRACQVSPGRAWSQLTTASTPCRRLCWLIECANAMVTPVPARPFGTARSRLSTRTMPPAAVGTGSAVRTRSGSVSSLPVWPRPFVSRLAGRCRRSRSVLAEEDLEALGTVSPRWCRRASGDRVDVRGSEHRLDHVGGQRVEGNAGSWRGGRGPSPTAHRPTGPLDHGPSDRPRCGGGHGGTNSRQRGVGPVEHGPGRILVLLRRGGVGFAPSSVVALEPPRRGRVLIVSVLDRWAISFSQRATRRPASSRARHVGMALRSVMPSPRGAGRRVLIRAPHRGPVCANSVSRGLGGYESIRALAGAERRAQNSLHRRETAFRHRRDAVVRRRIPLSQHGRQRGCTPG